MLYANKNLISIHCKNTFLDCWNLHDLTSKSATVQPEQVSSLHAATQVSYWQLRNYDYKLNYHLPTVSLPCLNPAAKEVMLAYDFSHILSNISILKWVGVFNTHAYTYVWTRVVKQPHSPVGFCIPADTA